VPRAGEKFNFYVRFCVRRAFMGECCRWMT
jgi:hypothetical protein